MVSAGLAFTSCEKFLTKNPPATLESATYFSDGASLELYANGFIEKMTPAAEDVYKGDATSDLVATRNSNTYLTTPWSPSSQTGWSASNWNNLYNINYFLVNIDKATKATEAEKTHWRAVARFWRALFYFNKVRTFGALPWYETPIDPDDQAQLYKPRDSREYIMQKVLEDLNYACINCSADAKWKKTSNIHKWIALAYKARVCLFEGTYRKYHSVDPTTGQAWKADEAELYLKECVKACEELIASGEYKLISNPANVETQYRSLFISDELQRDEVIWGIEAATPSTYHQSTWDYNNNNSQAWSMTANVAYMYLNLDGSRYTNASDYDKKLFPAECEGRDYRLKQTIMTPGYTRISTAGEKYLAVTNFTNTLTGYKIIKFALDDAKYDIGVTSYNDLPLIRYAEVLLAYAEAKAELNGGVIPADIWEKTIKPLRERAGVNGEHPKVVDPYLRTYYTTATTVDLLEIRRERATELFGEGQRYNDLMRWHEGDLLTNMWQGIYVPGLDVPMDLNGDGNPDICFCASKAGTTPGITYILLSDGQFTLSESTKGRVQYENAPRSWSEKMYLHPVPQTALNVNPDLGQNSGW
ncbi:MAG: RagB/SusD family nutrient uptake outer membrane protein [Bacteroidales bacterium]|nr:RagB/SusD family nutrient uptake outer membrane protein [Bacteroidales bacterium]